MTHLLTDEIIHAKKLGYTDDYGNWHYAEDALRAIADWQLERVIEWLNNNLGHSNYLEPLWPYKIDVDGVICDLKEAMRPQQQEDN